MTLDACRYIVHTTCMHAAYSSAPLEVPKGSVLGDPMMSDVPNTPCEWTRPLCGEQLLWRYNREAVALRIAFFMSAESGGVAHTVLVRDVPGLPCGTVAARIEDTALRFLPRFVKKRLVVRRQ